MEGIDKANKLAATTALPSVINNLTGKPLSLRIKYSAIKAVIIAIVKFKSTPRPKRNI